MDLQEKINLFRRRFAGREDVYGTQDTATGRICQVKAPVTDDIIAAHLNGEQPYGVYLLNNAHVSTAAVDFDVPSLEPMRGFLDQLKRFDLPGYVERSKSKGHHVWLFFNGPTLARDVRQALHHVLDEAGQRGVEVFPKQDQLGPQCPYGNFIFTPLSGQLVRQQRTVFVRPDDLTTPAPDQWKLLEDIALIAPEQLKEVLRLSGVSTSTDRAHKNIEIISRSGRSFSLPPCAQRMLAEGVRHHQRNACFRLGVHLHQLGMPRQAAEAVLLEWATHNHPENGKRIIQPPEIQEQLRGAYSGRYRSYGCDDPAIEPFCDPECPVRTRGAAHGSVSSPERNVPMSDPNANKPYRNFQLRGLQLTIWRNETVNANGEATTRYNISLNKQYKDKTTGNWMDTPYYFPEELPLLRAMLDKACEETLLTEPTPVTTGNAPEEESEPS